MLETQISTFRNNYAFLDGLRGMLAFYVLCHHFLGLTLAGVGPLVLKLSTPFRFGHSAVGFFIVISGFSLMLPVVRSVDLELRGSLRGYLIRRARRILPPYYAALALSVACVGLLVLVERDGERTVMVGELTARSLLSHLALVHTWVPGQSHTINMALWSVATEWHIYFLFPLVLLPIWRRVGATAAIVAAFAVGNLPIYLLGEEVRHGCPWYVGLFALGMLGAAITEGQRPPPPGGDAGVVAFILVGLSVDGFLQFGGARWLGGSDTAWLKDTAVGVVAAGVLILCAREVSSRAAVGRGPGPLSRLFASAPAVALGRFSYSLYATHCVILIILRSLSTRLGLSPDLTWLLSGTVGIPTALVVAYAFSRVFEEPFLRNRPGPAPCPDPPTMSDPATTDSPLL